MTAAAIVQITSPKEIRSFLLSDENYAAYALGDLDPPYSQHAFWMGAEYRGKLQAIALRYTALNPEALFLMGAHAGIEALLKRGVGSARVYFTARPDLSALLGKYCRLVEVNAMHRMRVTQQTFRPIHEALPQADAPTLLSVTDAPAIQQLLLDTSLLDGRELHDVAFAPSMVSHGYYYGLFDQERLIASAGTHLVARRSRIAAVGNVVVHPDYRGCGLGRVVIHAVTESLLMAGFGLIVLNVRQNNSPAIRTYCALGYQHIGDFIEGVAERRSTLLGDTV